MQQETPIPHGSVTGSVQTVSPQTRTSFSPLPPTQEQLPATATATATGNTPEPYLPIEPPVAVMPDVDEASPSHEPPHNLGVSVISGGSAPIVKLEPDSEGFDPPIRHMVSNVFEPVSPNTPGNSEVICLLCLKYVADLPPLPSCHPVQRTNKLIYLQKKTGIATGHGASFKCVWWSLGTCESAALKSIRSCTNIAKMSRTRPCHDFIVLESGIDPCFP